MQYSQFLLSLLGIQSWSQNDVFVNSVIPCLLIENACAAMSQTFYKISMARTVVLYRLSYSKTLFCARVPFCTASSCFRGVGVLEIHEARRVNRQSWRLRNSLGFWRIVPSSILCSPLHKIEEWDMFYRAVLSILSGTSSHLLMESTLVMSCVILLKQWTFHRCARKDQCVKSCDLV